jgi:hypothetical protein
VPAAAERRRRLAAVACSRCSVWDVLRRCTLAAIWARRLLAPAAARVGSGGGTCCMRCVNRSCRLEAPAACPASCVCTGSGRGDRAAAAGSSERQAGRRQGRDSNCTFALQTTEHASLKEPVGNLTGLQACCISCLPLSDSIIMSLLCAGWREIHAMWSVSI